MATVKTDNQHYQNIANAIREKNGESSATYLPSEMATAIANIQGSLGTFTLTEKSETIVTPTINGMQNVSFTFTTGKYYLVFYSCDEVGSSANYTLNSGFVLVDASNRTFIAESHTNANEQAPSVNTIFGTTTVKAHYRGFKTKSYREVKIGGYFA